MLTRRRGRDESRPYRDGDTTEWLLLKQPGVPAIAEPSDKPQKINHNRGTVAFSTRHNVLSDNHLIIIFISLLILFYYLTFINK